MHGAPTPIKGQRGSCRPRSLRAIRLIEAKGVAAMPELGYGGAGAACPRADTHYPPRTGLSSSAHPRAYVAAWKCSASDTMTDYAADCLSHEPRDSVIYLIGRPRRPAPNFARNHRNEACARSRRRHLCHCVGHASGRRSCPSGMFLARLPSDTAMLILSKTKNQE